MHHALLCCTLLGTILPEPPPRAKFWLEIQVIEFKGGVGPRPEMNSFQLPKDAKVIATAWHALDDRQPGQFTWLPAKAVLRSAARFKQYGGDRHNMEVTFEYISGPPGDRFSHEVTKDLDMAAGDRTILGLARAGGNRQRAFVVTVRRIK